MSLASAKVSQVHNPRESSKEGALAALLARQYLRIWHFVIIFLFGVKLRSPPKIQSWFFLYDWVAKYINRKRRRKKEPFFFLCRKINMALSRLRHPVISRGPSLFRARLLSSSTRSLTRYVFWSLRSICSFHQLKRNGVWSYHWIFRCGLVDIWLNLAGMMRILSFGVLGIGGCVLQWR